MKEKLSRLALSFALAIALYAAFLPSASAVPKAVVAGSNASGRSSRVKASK